MKWFETVKVLRFEIGELDVRLEVQGKPKEVGILVKWKRDRHRLHVYVVASPLQVHVTWPRRKPKPAGAQLDLTGPTEVVEEGGASQDG